MNEKEIKNFIKNTKKLVLTTILKYIDKNVYKNVYMYIDDIVQDIYVRFYLSLQKGQFQNKSKITTYLYQIAKNETFRYNEKIAKEQQKKDKIKQFWKLTNKWFYSSDSTDRIAIEKEEILNKSKYINTKQKEILKLYLNGYKLKEISEILGIQEGTVKSNLFRIKIKIKKNHKTGL